MRTLTILASVLFLWPAPLQAAPLDREQLAALLKEAQTAWQVPGLTVAVVQGDTVLLDAIGLRELGGTAPLTPDSLFGIGSVTKAMVATTLADLIARGKAEWDDPVRKHLNWFRLHDPLADRDATFRDLLCHRCGIARNDILWFGAPWGVEESVRRLAFVEPEAPFRASYRYNNLTYMATGLAIEATAGAPWWDVMRERIHKPLGMTRTMFQRKDVLTVDDRSKPHYLDEQGKWQATEWYDDDRQTRASGSVKSCSRDLATWLQFHLRGGVVDGKPLIERRVLDETYRPHNVMPVPPQRSRFAGTVQTSYALGWIVSDYRGEHLLEHGGAVDGFRAGVYFLPKKKLAVAVLTNCTEANVCPALGLTVIDRILGGEKTDWNKELPSRRAEELAGRKALKVWREAERKPDTRPSLAIETYSGTYRDLAYGTVEVEVKEGRLRLKWSSYIEPLEHYHYDTFVLPQRSPIGADPVQFRLLPSGKVGSLTLLGREFVRR